MHILAESVRRGVLGQARREIASAAGENKVLSRAEQGGLSADLQTAANAARAAKCKGARIDVNDVVDAYASVVTQQMRAVNTKGPKWLSIRETEQLDDQLQSRAWSVRASILSAKSGLSPAELRAAAADFVRVNSDGNGLDLYKGANHGEMGTQVALLGGDAAVTLAKFTALFMGGRAPEAITNFDPAKTAIIAQRVTEDEEELYVSVIDKKTGTVTHIDDLGVVDASYMVDEADFTALLGSDWFEYYDEIDHYDLIDRLVGGGVPLDTGGSEFHFGVYSTEAALTMLRAKFPGADIDAMAQQAEAAFYRAAAGGEVTWKFHADELEVNYKTDLLTLQFSGAFKKDGDTTYFHADFAHTGTGFAPMQIDSF